MSHEIMEHDKQQGRSMAWHKLTDIVPDLSLENCWLNAWDYAPRAVMVDGKNTPFSVLGVTDDCQVDILDDKGNPTGEKSPLLIGRPYQTKTFKPVLNKSLLKLVSSAIENKGLTLASVGTVFNRGRLFLSFSLAEAKFNAAGREFEAYLNIGNGNDMSSPLWVNTSNVCTVCNNTFTANLADAGMIMSVKKTQYSEFKLADMGRAIGAMLRGQKQFAQTLGQLAVVKCDENTAREFFAGFIAPNHDNPLSTRALNTIDRLVALFKTGAGNNGDDMADVFQGLTDYYTHEAASGKGDETANWKNFVSSEFGAGKTAKMESWNILTDAKLRKATIALGQKVLKITADADKQAA